MINRNALFLWIALLSVLNSCNRISKVNSIAQGERKSESSVIKSNTNQNFLGEYSLDEEGYGTKTIVTISDGKRIMTTNALPNHEVGNFPNAGNPNTISAQQCLYELPLNPVFTGRAK